MNPQPLRNMNVQQMVLMLAGLMATGPVFGQGQAVFRNTPTRAVIDGRTGLPVAQGMAMVGLYFTTDLTAVPDYFMPSDAFSLAAITPVSTSLEFPGVYSGGTIAIDGVPEGQEVLLQVRGWTGQEYESFAEALDSEEALLGVSNLMQVRLGGSSSLIPIPSISPMVEGFTLVAPAIFTNVPEPTLSVLVLLGGVGALLWRRQPERRDGAARRSGQ